MFFGIPLGTHLGSILERFWDDFRNQNGTKIDQKGHRKNNAKKKGTWMGKKSLRRPLPARGPAAGCQRALQRFFSHPSALLFCIVFSMPVLIDFSPILAPKIDPKSLQNRSKMGVKRDAKNHNEKSRISKPFWDDFSSIFDRLSRPYWNSSAPLFKAFLQTRAIKTQR